MAPQTSRRRAWTAIGLTIGVAAIGGGSWSLQRWAPFADEPPTVTWPANVQPLVDYVEAATQQHFVAPVGIEFIGDTDDYAARVATDRAEPTAADRADAATKDSVGRALGLWSGDVSVLDFREAYDNTAPFPATWMPDDNAIVVNADDGSADLTPSLRAELTLLLTQALDDQMFHMVRRAQAAPTSQDYQVVVAVGLGHAIWVHDQYVDDLSSDDSDAYYTDREERSADFVDVMSNVPDSFRSIRAVSQGLGPMFIASLNEEDPRLVAAAFTSNIPAALDQVSLPVGKYLRTDPLEAVAPPPGPMAADVQLSDQMGPFGLYLLLSTGLPANEALTAADGWGNDRYTAYRLADRVCVDVHLVADSRTDANRLENALNGWAQARPDDADALVARNGTDLYATACDPGTEARQPVPPEDAINLYFARAQEIQQRIDFSGKPGLAECVAVAFFARFTFDDFDGSVDIDSVLASIEQDCLDTV